MPPNLFIEVLFGEGGSIIMLILAHALRAEMFRVIPVLVDKVLVS